MLLSIKFSTKYKKKVLIRAIFRFELLSCFGAPRGASELPSRLPNSFREKCIILMLLSIKFSTRFKKKIKFGEFFNFLGPELL